MEKHEELFEKEYQRAKEMLSMDDMDLMLYGFVGGLKAVFRQSEDDRILIKEVLGVFTYSIDSMVERRIEKNEQKGVD